MHQLQSQPSPEESLSATPQITGKIRHNNKHKRHNKLHRKSRSRLAPEIRRSRVRIVHPLSDKDGTLAVERGEVGEDPGEDADCAEEEEAAGDVLDVAEGVGRWFVVEDYADEALEDLLDYLHADVERVT
jgi:hypothetical protein